MGTKDEVFKHPSYGAVSFSRITSSGKRRLFGSSMESHYHSVRLRIHEAELRINRDTHSERVSEERQIIEVELSAAQFAELLTTMNQGSGIPCTILRREGIGEIPEPPETPVETTNVRNDFAAKMTALEPELAARAKAIMDLLPASLNKGTRRQVEIQLERLAGLVTEHAPFALDQFQRAAERVTAAAKAEIDAVTTHVVYATGIKALREMNERGETPQLPAHEDESK